MNTKQIAQTIKDYFQIYEDSYVDKDSIKHNGLTYPMGDYSVSKEEAFQQACEKNKINPDMWYVLYLAASWGNDLQEWADNILEYGSFEGMFVTEMLEEKEEIISGKE